MTDITDTQIEKLIQERFEAAMNETTSKDRVVHIAWLAKGIDIWHKSGGKMGHTPEDAMHFIISSVTRLIAEECNKARLDELEKIYDKRTIYALEIGKSVYMVRANNIKQRIIELTKPINKENTQDD